jgi:hypothetical protein
MSVTTRSVILITLAGLLIAGCTGKVRKGPVFQPYKVVSPDQEVTADAWLFNARAYRDGKPTTLRLNVYRTDSVVGVTGTGYLGKGAFRAILTEDTVMAYFPNSNEYFLEPIDSLFGMAECGKELSAPNLMRLLTSRPDSNSIDMTAQAPYRMSDDRWAYTVTWLNCPWRMVMEYERRDERWILDELRFERGDSFRFTSICPVFKSSQKVDADKFRVAIPPGAARVTP